MQKTWPVFALITFFVASAVHASDDVCFEKAQTQAQLNECAAVALKLADGELNAIYLRMQNRLKEDTTTKELLIDAQRKWLGFRDAECSFSAVRSAGGSSHGMQVNSCLTELTRTRVMELQNHVACGRRLGEQEAMQCALPRAGR